VVLRCVSSKLTLRFSLLGQSTYSRARVSVKNAVQREELKSRWSVLPALKLCDAEACRIENQTNYALPNIELQSP
jgi:hypothetical protein